MNPHFIKIDAEGSEIFILKGSIQTILKYKPEIFDINNSAIQNMNPNQAYNFLTGLNSHIRNLIEANPSMNLGQISALISYP